VDPASLLTEVAAVIREFIVLEPEQADAAALWLSHTHLTEVAENVAYRHHQRARAGLCEDPVPDRAWADGAPAAASIQCLALRAVSGD
jgi:hypothetical protein